MKEDLDAIFSKYIRLKFADWKLEVSCYTCSWRGLWTECDCGHFISRSYLITRFEENNCRPQCKNCNQHLDGNIEIFEEELREELGDEEVDNLFTIKNEMVDYDDLWYAEKIAVYKKLVSRLRSEV